jgi:hypothetical protein
MILSTFITFSPEEKERIDRLIDDLDLYYFFDSVLYSDTLDKNKKNCLIGFIEIQANIKEFKNLDILNPNINDNIRWVFSYTEDKNFYKKTIIDYINNTISNHINKYTYNIIDYYFLENLIDNTVDNLIDTIITKPISKSLIIDKSIYFIFSNEPYVINNISLKMIKYYNGSSGVIQISDYFIQNSLQCIQDVKKETFNKLRETIDKDWLDDVLLERYLITLV